MPRHLQGELDTLKRRILSLSTMVEERVRMAINAVDNNDEQLARHVIDADREIDELEVEVEEDCLKVIALHQPVAVDLRFISAVIKINNDLERIGDLAVNIAERVVNIASRPPLPMPVDFSSIAEKTQDMLKNSLDALVNMDTDLAYKVWLADDEVDELNRDIYDLVKDEILKNPKRVGAFINMLLISRHLERIADHTTNIAEEVIYMIEGVIPRHPERKADAGDDEGG